MAVDNLRESISFVVGEERALLDVISEAEIAPLLTGTIRGGANRVLLKLADGDTIWSHGASPSHEPVRFESALTLEGEMVGTIVVEGPRDQATAIKGLSDLLAVAVQTILTNNLKRMLTTEIHTTVVNQSYDELLATNKKLTLSEAKYRELAENLERKVEARTLQLQKVHTRLLQQEKLAAVGQLAAGMAHEINNPLGFISSNLNTLKKYVDALLEMLELYRSTFVETVVDDQIRERLLQKGKKLKLDFILSDFTDLFSQSNAGCKRVGKIVADLKGFSHIDESQEIVADLNQEIDRTLSVLGHQIPADATIIKNYGALSGFTCNAAQLCHVFLNIINNAVLAKPLGLLLTIETKQDSDQITILFTDNGPGIPPAVIGRVFEPFFTTKDVGAGMGMGLAVAYDVITAYGGTIEARNLPSQGASFMITLPAGQQSAAGKLAPEN